MAQTINAYSQPTRARYNPRTLQDQMIAPMYMREQHNALDESRAALEGQIAQQDGMAEHDAVLQAEQAKLYAELQAQGDTLEREGFSPSARSNFLRFNKEYQTAVGPKGNLGKIAAAKAAFDQERSELLKNGTTMGYGPDQIQLQIDAARKQYGLDFAETGEIKNMDMPMPAKFQDLDADIKGMKAQLGSVTTQRFKDGTYEIINDDTGIHILNTKTQAKLKGTNAQNIKDAVTNLIGKYTGEGLGAQSLPWQGLSQEHAIEQIKSGLAVQKITDDRDIIDERWSPLNGFDNVGADEGVPQRDFYTSSGQTLPVGKDYKTIKKNSDAILNNPTSSSKDIAKAREYQKIMEDTDIELQDNPAYVRNKRELENIRTSEYVQGIKSPTLKNIMENMISVDVPVAIFGKSVAGFDYTLENGEQGTINYMNIKDEEGMSQKELDEARKYVSKHSSGINRFGSNVQSLRDESIKQIGFEKTDIDVPFVKTSEEGLQMTNALKMLTRDNIRPENISIFNSDGTNLPIEADEAGKMALIGLFEKADPSDIQKINISKQGSQVGFTIKFSPKEGTSLDTTTSAFDEENFSGLEDVEMFVPINQLVDPITGAKHSPTHLLTLLPEDLRREAVKGIQTSNLSSTSDVDALGVSKIPLEKYFPNTDPNSKLDFLSKKENGTRTYTPYRVTDSTKQAFNWNMYLPEEPGDPKNDQVMRSLYDYGVIDVLVKTAKTNPELVEKYNLNSARQKDIKGLVREMNNQNIQLMDESDISELSDFYKYVQQIAE